MSLTYLLPRCNTLRKLQAAHAAAATTAGATLLRPAETLTSLLQTLTLLRPLPPPSLSLPYALSLFRSLPHPASTLAHNLLIRLLPPLPALRLFSRLRRLSLPPDRHSFPLALSAAARLRLLPAGRALHAQSLRSGFSSDLFVRNALISFYSSCASIPDAEAIFHISGVGIGIDIVSYNALIAGYAKNGNLKNAHHLFDRMPERDSISYATMIAAYSHSGQHSDALNLFDEMRARGFEPDNAALASSLSSCAQIGELNLGKSIHGYIRRTRDDLTVSLLTGLVDMYAKCGEMDAALNLFDENPSRNLFTWNSIIVGLATHGYGDLSLLYFEKMRLAGVAPDGVTFVGVLAGCRIHRRNVEVAAEKLLEMDSGDTGVYSIMAGIYAEERRWGDLGRIRRIMEGTKVKKNIGFSLVQ